MLNIDESLVDRNTVRHLHPCTWNMSVHVEVNPFSTYGIQIHTTRMHSSRMRTICCSGHLSCHACPPAMHAPWHAPPAMHTTPSPCMPPSPVDRMTDACENITFLQLLLRMVKIKRTQYLCQPVRTNPLKLLNLDWLSRMDLSQMQ